ncbi:type II secretion system secretin GspD [Caulobacter sp. SLTY]|uniref:type II secretion system secretin GspD n=1 Tax=Caulobacter sp. SLTY TaxID=2683262 RepID=UPI001411F16D|nr:type II secretion system secretin GspD [Caulobacter sp. SLTY]NBB14787.1 type II secretion system secretin GspD [Caulobacter sp. SLTY]
MLRKPLRTLALALALTASGLASTAPAIAQTQVLNVQDADIRAFIQDVARSTGMTFIIDPRVKGTVSVASDGPLTKSELFDVFLATLRSNGFLAVPTGPSTYRIEPAENAARQPGVARSGFVTEVFRMRTVDAAAAAEMIKPLVGPQGVVTANPRGNTIVVADYADNVRRIRGLVAQIDQDRSQVQTVTLKHSSATEVARVLNELTSTSGADGKGQRGAVSIVPVESSNSIILRGDPDAVARLLPTIADLDRRAEANADVQVIFLQHANAEEMLPVLQQLLGQTPTTPSTASGSTSRGSTDSASTAAAPASSATPGAQRANIARYPGANALIISADPATQRMLANVIRQLDVRREQVVVEAIVVEISDGTAQRLGVQTILGGGDNVPFAATNYSNTGPNILALTGAIVGQQSLPEDSDLLAALQQTAIDSLIGSNGALAAIGGTLSGDSLFGFIINAVREDNSSKLLSTPHIMTLNNREATFLVGQEVPITTGETLGDGNDNPFRTIQRQDVGIRLTVRPQINAGGGITLHIRQEVSAIAGTVSTNSPELILNKRVIETTAVIDDGEIVVLGGLLQQDEQISLERTPLLSDVPILGELFKSRAREGKRTNLMIFLRPRIVRNGADARAIAGQRYEMLRQDPALTGKDGVNSLDKLVIDQLDAVPPTVPPPPPAPAPAPPK